MQDLLEMDELAQEIVEKRILHWNCRGYEEVPHALKWGQNIDEIYLKWNKLSYLPPWIGKLKNITNLYLQYNQLVCLPEELSELSQLNVLDVTCNLICALPLGIGHLQKLSQLLAADNALSCVPNGGFSVRSRLLLVLLRLRLLSKTEFQMLQALQILDLSFNKFKKFPDAVLHCKGLEEINFDSNCLTSLPDNIVYLPHLTTLSVGGNNLLYLPFLPFLSNPFISFENNRNLNYLSIWQGQQITLKSNGTLNPECPWILPRAQGCFEVHGPPQVSIGDILVRDYSTGNIVPLILPPRLKWVSSGPNCQPVVAPLLELTLRMVYSLGDKLEIQKSKHEKVHQFDVTKFCLNNQIYDCLPPVLQQQLVRGPVTICYFCNKPIFMYGVIWVITKDCYVGSGFDPLCNILSTIVFCSVSCSSLSTHCERTRSIHNNLESRKLNLIFQK